MRLQFDAARIRVLGTVFLREFVQFDGVAAPFDVLAVHAKGLSRWKADIDERQSRCACVLQFIVQANPEFAGRARNKLDRSRLFDNRVAGRDRNRAARQPQDGNDHAEGCTTRNRVFAIQGSDFTPDKSRSEKKNGYFRRPRNSALAYQPKLRSGEPMEDR